jgi:hypothetical protein
MPGVYCGLIDMPPGSTYAAAVQKLHDWRKGPPERALDPRHLPSGVHLCRAVETRPNRKRAFCSGVAGGRSERSERWFTA